jgi:hypothetical protein
MLVHMHLVLVAKTAIVGEGPICRSPFSVFCKTVLSSHLDKRIIQFVSWGH